MIHVVCVFLGIYSKQTAAETWEGHWESVYSLSLWAAVTRAWPETPGIVTTIGHVNNLYQMSSNVTFQLYTPPKFSTLRQIHKSENPPKNSGRGHSTINLITNFARGWFLISIVESKFKMIMELELKGGNWCNSEPKWHSSVIKILIHKTINLTSTVTVKWITYCPTWLVGDPCSKTEEKWTKLYPEKVNLIQFVLFRFPPRFIHISTLVLTSLLPEKP